MFSNLASDLPKFFPLYYLEALNHKIISLETFIQSIFWSIPSFSQSVSRFALVFTSTHCTYTDSLCNGYKVMSSIKWTFPCWHGNGLWFHEAAYIHGFCDIVLTTSITIVQNSRSVKCLVAIRTTGPCTE